ncbi:MAG: Uracil-DNA glycosylase [Candidatus Woesebacteria bacterium GW2011_GWB1_43_14]|uniref:Uracil-DNA glycosylase n=1 Tax=Candidatus Woesebacteria bacterium GW2011_GWB1_43_14 TaxID=1618578 RepID=A0A0G1DM12_9BACT|nr:MAG: Uracil-DNA glycosylase [Candidatus Woesebacteria bacterium GW2011_GWC1_42_9]KKS98920.1 MAG: Uracil-DNA glycosylase [Candidatus Woesebacteria bacterium GW2011_GWB1_43_14]
MKIEKNWKEALNGEFEKPYFRTLAKFVKEEYSFGTVYPSPKLVFNAFDSCPFDKVKVVILGQDPYHGQNQAHGLAFSVRDSVEIPPSLINIYKEIEDDLGIKPPKSGNLTRWTKQGVLLLNATLTVRANLAGSHQKKGWEEFTDAAITALSEKKKNLVFMLWGSYAQNKGEVINKSRHLVLEAPHPSPLSASRGFFGCRHFSACNLYLIMHGKEPIEW